MSDDTEPQPDLTLLRHRSDYYDSGLLGPEDILLVVEVADISVAYDRRLKIPLYGRSGIAEAWLIDLNRGTVTVYRDTGPAGHGVSREVRRGEDLAPVARSDRVLRARLFRGRCVHYLSKWWRYVRGFTRPLAARR